MKKEYQFLNVRYKSVIAKALLFFLLLVSSSLSINAQTESYDLIFKEGKSWNLFDYKFGETNKIVLSKENENIINGKKYYLISYGGLFRDDSLGNVYRYDYNEEYLVFSFSFDVGYKHNTKIQSTDDFFYTILDKKDTVIFGIKRKIVKVNEFDIEGRNFVWIEGIGRLSDPGFGDLTRLTTSDLLCAYDFNEQIYKNTKWNSCDTTFVNIKPITQNKNVLIQVIGKVLEIKSITPLPARSKLEIISLNGTIVEARGFNPQEMINCQIQLKAGMYIVKFGDTSNKIIIP